MKTINAKFTLEEHQRIKIAAACVGAKLSTIVRNNLMRWVEEVENSSFHPGYRGEEGEAVDSGPETPSPNSELPALEAELMRIDGVDEISGVYVEEFGYVEPGDPEYPEALRAYVENHRKGPENEPEPVATGEPETLENEDSELEQAETVENKSPEDPDADFGFPDEEPKATKEPEEPTTLDSELEDETDGD